MATDKKRTHSEKLENGDVVRVRRKYGVLHYDHYGIYVEEDNSVIHYNEPDPDKDNPRSRRDSCGKVLQTSLDEFLDGAESLTVCRYPEEVPRHPLSLVRKTFEVRRDEIEDKGASSNEADPDSPGAKAVEEAKRRKGESRYHLVRNNCEHFAVECRYNYHAAGQVQAWATVLGLSAVAVAVGLPLALSGLGKGKGKGILR